MTNEEIFHELKTAGLAAVADRLIPLVKHCVCMESFPVDDDKDIPIGASKIGGLPDMPENIVWPQWQDTPLAFLCQVHLADLAKYPCCSDLPPVGWLYFFYDIEHQNWGYDPQHAGSWRVFYYDGTPENLTRRDFPYDKMDTPPDDDDEIFGVFDPCRVSFYEFISFPESESRTIEEIVSDDELDSYVEFIESLSEKHPCSTQHQLIGYPNPMQGYMPLLCQLVSNGLYLGDSSGWDDPRREVLAPGAKDWHLLLQLDTDDNAQMIWGDVGRLYFWIRQQDLHNRNFDNVWLQLQCG